MQRDTGATSPNICAWTLGEATASPRDGSDLEHIVRALSRRLKSWSLEEDAVMSAWSSLVVSRKSRAHLLCVEKLWKHQQELESDLTTEGEPAEVDKEVTTEQDRADSVTAVGGPNRRQQHNKQAPSKPRKLTPKAAAASTITEVAAQAPCVVSVPRRKTVRRALAASTSGSSPCSMLATAALSLALSGVKPLSTEPKAGCLMNAKVKVRGAAASPIAPFSEAQYCVDKETAAAVHPTKNLALTPTVVATEPRTQLAASPSSPPRENTPILPLSRSSLPPGKQSPKSSDLTQTCAAAQNEVLEVVPLGAVEFLSPSPALEIETAVPSPGDSPSGIAFVSHIQSDSSNSEDFSFAASEESDSVAPSAGHIPASGAVLIVRRKPAPARTTMPMRSPPAMMSGNVDPRVRYEAGNSPSLRKPSASPPLSVGVGSAQPSSQLTDCVQSVAMDKTQTPCGSPQIQDGVVDAKGTPERQVAQADVFPTPAVRSSTRAQCASPVSTLSSVSSCLRDVPV